MTDFSKMSKEELTAQLQNIAKAQPTKRPGANGGTAPVATNKKPTRAEEIAEEEHKKKKQAEKEFEDKRVSEFKNETGTVQPHPGQMSTQKSEDLVIPSWQDISKAYHPVQMKDGQRVITPEEYEAEKLANKVTDSDGTFTTSDSKEIKEYDHLGKRYQFDGTENTPAQVRYKDSGAEPAGQQKMARMKVESEHPSLAAKSKDTAKSDGEPEIPSWAQIAKGNVPNPLAEDKPATPAWDRHNRDSDAQVKGMLGEGYTHQDIADAYLKSSKDNFGDGSSEFTRNYPPLSESAYNLIMSGIPETDRHKWMNPYFSPREDYEDVPDHVGDRIIDKATGAYYHPVAQATQRGQKGAEE